MYACGAKKTAKERGLAFRNWRATGEFLEICIPHIAQIIEPNLAGEKSIRRELSQEPEELDSLP
jgi:hypothetical protein